jgi:hypothetical protein
MDKKEAIQHIIYHLKEIESTRLRLGSARPEGVDIEIALLNQQVLNVYQQLQNYRSGLYASQPAQVSVKQIETSVQKEVHADAPLPPTKKEEAETIIHETPKPEPIKIPDPVSVLAKRPVEVKAPEPETELKRENKDAAQRKERLKRLEDEAAKIEASRKNEEQTPEPAVEGKIGDFTEIVEEKYEEADIAHDEARVSGANQDTMFIPHHHRPEAEVTLNEKLQSGTSLHGSLNDKFQQNDAKKTLAEKMKLGPITDLKAAMALNQKIAFTNGLFNGDDKEFKKVLNFLGSCRNFSEAKIYLQTEIGKIYKWDDNDPLVSEFTELVYRKFL